MEQFELSGGGHFMSRRGPAHGFERHRHKLCFVSTDVDVLASVLDELAELPSCVFVKYSTKPVAGMHIGRCLLTDGQQVGKLWRQFRDHSHVICTVQDDEFVAPFRSA